MVKKIHQVWVQGEDELPDEFKRNRELWQQAFPDFELVLWDEQTARARWQDVNAHFDKCFHHATRADLILARAIRDYGGLATGTDSTPNNPEALRKLMEIADAIAVITPGRTEMPNGLQWSAAPGHPFWECVTKHQLRDGARHLSNPDVPTATGPGCYMEAFRARKWNMHLVTTPVAFTHDWSRAWVPNRRAFINPGYAASWAKG